MPMHEPVLVPDLKPQSEIREHIESMRGRYRGLVVVVLDMMGRIDVLAMIEEVDVVEWHQAH